jgi:hypothetical protein
MPCSEKCLTRTAAIPSLVILGTPDENNTALPGDKAVVQDWPLRFVVLAAGGRQALRRACARMTPGPQGAFQAAIPMRRSLSPDF